MGWLMWLLVIALVIAAIIAKIKRSARIVVFRNEDGRIRVDGHDRPQPHDQGSSSVERMVSCAQCGIYIPTSEAVFRTGKVYCCEEHSIQP